MSKKKRQNKTTTSIIKQAIFHSLRADFYFTDEEIELIANALAGRAPIDVVEHMQAIHDGKVPLPVRPTLVLDMEDGTSQNLTLTNHPITLLYDYLMERYGEGFGPIYWTAFTTTKPEQFYEMLKYHKKAPFFSEARDMLRNRTLSPGRDEGE